MSSLSFVKKPVESQDLTHNWHNLDSRREDLQSFSLFLNRFFIWKLENIEERVEDLEDLFACG
jgi:hypothetical protein